MGDEEIVIIISDDGSKTVHFRRSGTQRLVNSDRPDYPFREGVPDNSPNSDRPDYHQSLKKERSS